MKSIIFAFLLLIGIVSSACKLHAQNNPFPPTTSSGAAGAIACVGAPGNTTGSYRQQCQVAVTGAIWACNNASNCTVSADWVAVGAAGLTVSSGTYASAPATCTPGGANGIYFPNNSVITQLLCTGTNTYTAMISGLSGATPPVLANFTVVNAGSTTTDTTRGGVIFNNPTTESGFNVHAYVKNVPATPYHIVGCFMMTGLTVSNAMMGMAFYNSSSAKLSIFGPFQAATSRWVAFNMTNVTTSSATPINASVDVTFSPYLRLRIGDDGTTNRTFDFSQDKIGPWINLGSEGRTSGYTANQVGFFINAGPQGFQMVDYSETN